MVSSKFSGKVIQQPPPICKPPPPPPPIIPPPPPHGPTLWCDTTFNGSTVGGRPINESMTLELRPDIPANQYEGTKTIVPWKLNVIVSLKPAGNYKWTCWWHYAILDVAIAGGHADLPDEPPVDTEILYAEYTHAAGGTATIRLYTKPLV